MSVYKTRHLLLSFYFSHSSVRYVVLFSPILPVRNLTEATQLASVQLELEAIQSGCGVPMVYVHDSTFALSFQPW